MKLYEAQFCVQFRVQFRVSYNLSYRLIHTIDLLGIGFPTDNDKSLAAARTLSSAIYLFIALSHKCGDHHIYVIVKKMRYLGNTPTAPSLVKLRGDYRNKTHQNGI